VISFGVSSSRNLTAKRNIGGLRADFNWPIKNFPAGKDAKLKAEIRLETISSDFSDIYALYEF